MPDETNAEDTLSPAVRDRSTRRGDVPEGLARRYFTDGRGGDGLGFYVDARVQAAAFRDRGRELVANRADPNAIRDMTAIAQHRGWTIVTVRGSTDFRREAWLAGRSIGLEVRGYRATERDLQELEHRRAQRERRGDRAERAADLRDTARARHEDRAGGAQMRVVEAVVRARVKDEDGQRRIMDRARARIADWLERGAGFEPLRAQDRTDADGRRERQRGR